MRSRILLSTLCAFGLFVTMVPAAPPGPGQRPTGPANAPAQARPPAPKPPQVKKKQYTVWFRDPADVCWRKYGTYQTRAAADAAAAQVKRDNPDWATRVDEV